jgi:hypothetical protein
MVDILGNIFAWSLLAVMALFIIYIMLGILMFAQVVVGSIMMVGSLVCAPFEMHNKKFGKNQWKKM